VTQDEVRAFVRERLGSVKAPKQVEVWADLPRSKVGKVLKPEIKSQLRAQQSGFLSLPTVKPPSKPGTSLIGLVTRLHPQEGERRCRRRFKRVPDPPLLGREPIEALAALP
jgi:hypothetical protein